MAAPPPGQPLSVTVGAVWRFHLVLPPSRPQQQSVEVTATRVIVSLLRLIFGIVYFSDCPQQPKIPIYLLGLALVLLVVVFMTPPCASDMHHSREPNCCKACVMLLMSLFGLFLVLAGDVWVLSIYQPNYDPTAADGLYCSKTLYTFAFWSAVWETFALCYFLVKFCRGLMCYVVVIPIRQQTETFTGKSETRSSVRVDMVKVFVL